MKSKSTFYQEYWEIVKDFLQNCNPIETMEYIVGHNYDADSEGLWYIAKNFETEKGAVANIFWRLLPLYEGNLIHEEPYLNEFYLLKFIADNFYKYSDGKYGSQIDAYCIPYIALVLKDFPECPQELVNNIDGEIISIQDTLHTYEGLPESINNKINVIRKQRNRKSLP